MPTLSTPYLVRSKLNYLLVLTCLGGFLSGCSIENLVAEDAKIENHMYQEEPVSNDPVDIFIADCNKCIRGEVELFPQLVETYYSSFTPSTQYQTGQFKYQQIAPTSAFEKCAEKANAMGDKTAFSQLMIRPARIARTARYFYIQKDYRQGAYWIQRLININGEMDGLQVAGRVFIQDMRTIDIGVRLLEQSARLGNRDAKQMLLGLMQPGSSYYQSITSNTLLDDEISVTQSGAPKAEEITELGTNKQQNANSSANNQGNAGTAAQFNQSAATESESEQEGTQPEASQDNSMPKEAQEGSTVSTDSTNSTGSTDNKNSAKAENRSSDQSNEAATSDSQTEAVSEGQFQHLKISEQKRQEQAERIKQMRANADAAAKAASQE